MKKNKPIEFNQVDPDIQECKIIILHVISQSVKDYEQYRDKTKQEEIDIHDSARDFLFSDDYMFDWGDEFINLRQLCDTIEIDVDWLRNRVVKKLDLKFNLDGTIIPSRKY